MTTTIYGAPGVPEVVYATVDRRYGLTTLHGSRAEAAREQAREPNTIDVVEYEPTWINSQGRGRHRVARTTPKEGIAPEEKKR